MRRSPYGERGLKYAVGVRHGRRPGRSPYGERGLKFHGQSGVEDALRRSPYGERGLKLLIASCAAAFPETSLSLRRAWIEMCFPATLPRNPKSLSLRRAWIEIASDCSIVNGRQVALLTESVD